jgi:hypothetical protein
MKRHDVEVVEDIYRLHRYPTVEPPKWQARCSCGWEGWWTTSMRDADADGVAHRRSMIISGQALPGTNW